MTKMLTKMARNIVADILNNAPDDDLVEGCVAVLINSGEYVPEDADHLRWKLRFEADSIKKRLIRSLGKLE